MRSRLQHLRRGEQNGRHAAFETVGLLGVFERMQGGEIFARIHPVSALVAGSGSEAERNSFARTIRLVE
jgi:hypothetical protein